MSTSTKGFPALVRLVMVLPPGAYLFLFCRRSRQHRSACRRTNRDFDETFAFPENAALLHVLAPGTLLYRRILSRVFLICVVMCNMSAAEKFFLCITFAATRCLLLHRVPRFTNGRRYVQAGASTRGKAFGRESEDSRTRHAR